VQQQTGVNVPPPGPPAQATTLGPGAIVDLPPGEKATFANPQRPNAQFDPFFVAMVKQIGAALEIPGDELLMTYAGSYTAARAAMLQAWRFYIMRRESLATQLCQPVYSLLIDEEVASGRLTLPGYADPRLRCAWLNCMWIGPARGAMDEEKEARAAKLRIEIGVSNEARECQQMSGESRRAIYAEQLREINQRKKDGTWETRPTGTIRVSPLTDPNAEAKPPSQPADQELEEQDA
jgi:capsid protein